MISLSHGFLCSPLTKTRRTPLPPLLRLGLVEWEGPCTYGSTVVPYSLFSLAQFHHTLRSPDKRLGRPAAARLLEEARQDGTRALQQKWRARASSGSVREGPKEAKARQSPLLTTLIRYDLMLQVPSQSLMNPCSHQSFRTPPPATFAHFLGPFLPCLSRAPPVHPALEQLWLPIQLPKLRVRTQACPLHVIILNSASSISTP